MIKCRTSIQEAASTTAKLDHRMDPHSLSDDDRKVWEQYINGTYVPKSERKIPLRPARKQKLSFILDLHNLTIYKAWETTKSFLEDHSLHGSQEVIIITGKGIIYDEFEKWFHQTALSKLVKNVKEKKTTGAFDIQIKKKGG